MSYEFYKVLHLLGVFMVVASLGAAIIYRGAESQSQAHWRKTLSIGHGVGLVIALVAGFGLVAKLGVGFPGWVVVKVVIWLVLGGLIAFAKRKPALAKTWWWLTILLATLAGGLAVYKPF
jgi:hypothetical protein